MSTLLDTDKIPAGHATPPPTTLPSQKKRRYRWGRVLAWLAGLFLLVLALYFTLAWPWLSRWGATTVEVQQPMPGDELVPQPVFVTTKAVTIHAPPEAIWPWLVQLGVDRGGMYSYLWVENWLLRLNVTNTEEIRPEWQQIAVGDFLRFTPKEYPLNPGPGLYVKQIEPNRALVACFGMENTPPDCTYIWQFLLAPQPDGSTRLILRGTQPAATSWLANAGAKVVQTFPFYMERKMLLTLKERAERGQ